MRSFIVNPIERTRIYLVRHGQVKGYDNFQVHGHSDVDLTETGKLQLQQMAERLRLVEINSIYSSDLKRAVYGSRRIAQYHNVPLFVLPELRESYFGDWEGLTFEEIRKLYPEELDKRQADLVNYQSPGGGEVLSDFAERIMTCLNKILAEQKNCNIAIVAHGGVNRVILCNALGLDYEKMFNIHQEYGCLNIIDYFSDSTNLVRLMNGLSD